LSATARSVERGHVEAREVGVAVDLRERHVERGAGIDNGAVRSDVFAAEVEPHRRHEVAPLAFAIDDERVDDVRVFAGPRDAAAGELGAE
jgi:hypothetical protein